MSCFYCGSKLHKSYGCPTRAIEGAEDQIAIEIDKRSKNLNNSLEQIGNAMISEISEISLQMSEISDEIASLNNTLHIGFSEIIKELQSIYNLMVKVLPHPIVVAARDLYEIGLKMFRRGFLEDAEKKFLEAKERDPSAFVVYAALGELYVEKGDNTKAMNYFKLAERNSEKSEQLAYACLLQSRLFMSESNYSSAVKRMMKAVDCNPNSSIFWYALAQCAAGAGDVGLCLKALNKAIQKDRNSYSKAFIDPYLDKVKDDIIDYFKELCKEKYNEALKVLETVKNDLLDFGKLDSSWYVPKSYKEFSIKIKTYKDSLNSEKFFPSLKVLDEQEELIKSIEKMKKKAITISNSHKSKLDEEWSWGGVFVLTMGSAFWGTIFSLVVLAFSKAVGPAEAAKAWGYSFTGGGIIATGAFFYGIHKREQWWSKDFIIQKYKSE